MTQQALAPTIAASNPLPMPSVLLLDRYVLSWPTENPEKPWLDAYAATPVPIDQALVSVYDSDAHFVAYTSDRRLNTNAAGKCKIVLQVVVVDVDAPGHAPTAEWREGERAKIARLRAIAPGFVAYDTKGGYRLVWRLSEPLELKNITYAALWSEIYLGWLKWLEREAGIVGDPRCADWTHIFRLPFVKRDGQDQRLPCAGDLRTGTWDLRRGCEFWRPAATVAANTNAAEHVTVIDETDGESGPVEIVEPLLDRIVVELREANLWDDNRQDYFLSFLGWLLGKGWSRPELERLVERMPNNGKYRGMVKRARSMSGPGEIRDLLPTDAWARLDATVNAHPNAVEAEQQRRADEAEFSAAMGASQPQPSAAPQATAPASATAPVAAPAATPKAQSKQLTTAEVVNILGAGEWADVIGYDALANRVVCLKEPPMRKEDDPGVPCVGEWTDAHTNRARTWIFQNRGMEPGKDAADSAVEIVARRRSFHPVQAYLKRLRWDGVPRLDTVLARYFGADATEYTRQVGSKTMIAAVARAMDPGCKVDTMAILEGAQGIGKSRGVRALAGDEWFADTPLDLESKDAAQCLQGNWIYEIGELHSFNRTETTRIKAFVSSQSDNVRPSYGRRNQDFPRQCIFVGTTNGAEYLTDTTGNRRYWPVKCRNIDVPGLQRDRDQLWAEALQRYLAGERWWLEGAEVALAEAQQADREAIDPWEQPLCAWLGDAAGVDGTRSAVRAPFTMAEALSGALRLSPQEQTQANATRVGKLLAQQGWRARKERHPVDPTKYVRVYVKAVA